MIAEHQNRITTKHVRVPLFDVLLSGDLTIPDFAQGIVIFAHASGSSRFNSRNRLAAEILQDHGLGTLLIDLLTQDEEGIDEITREFRFNVPILAERLIGVADWLHGQAQVKHFDLGYFSCGTGSGAALIAASQRPQLIHAVVTRSGRPDLAEDYFSAIKAPTLLMVGEYDKDLLTIHEQAKKLMHTKSALKIIPGATHLFEETGTLEQVAKEASEWFGKYLFSHTKPNAQYA